jgi:hypothetical protein
MPSLTERTALPETGQVLGQVAEAIRSLLHRGAGPVQVLEAGLGFLEGAIQTAARVLKEDTQFL